MFADLDQKIAGIIEALSSMGMVKGMLFALFFLAVWFLPAIAAIFFNRRHLGKIFLANIPAIASWMAWLALLAWAVTGKVRNRKGAGKKPELSAL